jgi:hypothetical protein
VVSGYIPGTDFDTVFGRNQFSPDITLLDALQLGGGDPDAIALARHATAALLNAGSGMTFPFSVQGVIDLYQDAMDGLVTVADAHNQLAQANEEGCPFDGDNDHKLNQEEWPGCVADPDCDDDTVSDGMNDPDGTGPITVGEDNCMIQINPSQSNFDSDPEGDVCDVDDDNDGFSDDIEQHIGTGGTNNCAGTAAPDDESDDGWGADVNDDQRLNIADFNSFVFPLRADGSLNKFGHTVPDLDDPLLVRWDLDPSSPSISIADINALNPAVNNPTSRPPMFGGQPAFAQNCLNAQ